MQKEIQVYLTKFLKQLQHKIPTGKARHNFQIGDDGVLTLWIMVNNKWQSILFDDYYDDMIPEELVDNIINHLKEAGYKI